jgi:glycosyltransferase involved in cell wall biosynthesis
MRIALVSTLATRVRQRGSGSVEGLVWLLSRELTALGHDVTVFAAGGSEPCGELVAALPGPYGDQGSPDDWQLCEWINLGRAVEQSGRFDVLHSHAYLWGLPLEPLCRVPMVHTTHVCPHKDAVRLWALRPGACVTAVSDYQWSAFPGLRPAAVIRHGVDATQFTFRREPEDYVCYLGRFIPGKGPLDAIAAARSLGLRLLLAGPRNDYFRKHVEPLVDERTVEYLGPLGGPERDRLLGGARALLYPLREPEPFGLVPVEAMLCGTPVAAVRLGAVPEIVEEGLTGSSAAAVDGFREAVLRALTLDRRWVQERAAQRFSASRMAREYAEVYQRVVAGGDAR